MQQRETWFLIDVSFDTNHSFEIHTAGVEQLVNPYWFDILIHLCLVDASRAQKISQN